MYEVICGLAICHFAVAFAEITHSNPEYMWMFTLSIDTYYWYTDTKVSLCLFTEHAFHPTKRYHLIFMYMCDKSVDTV